MTVYYFFSFSDSLETDELSTCSEEHMQAQESSNTLSGSEWPSNRKLYNETNQPAEKTS